MSSGSFVTRCIGRVKRRRRDEIDAEREVGNEMGVHHIHVEVIHAVAFQLLDVALQIHQIGAHDRNRYFSFFGGLHGVFIMLAD